MESDHLEPLAAASAKPPWYTTGIWIGLLILASIGVIAATVVRSYTRYDDPQVAAFDSTRQGQFDFHNGVYFPSLAYSRGVNPYGEVFANTYPVSRQIPPYSPLTLLLHVPLSWLPIRAAEIVYLVINLTICWWLACLTVASLDAIGDKRTASWLVFFLIVSSRAGHTTLFTGYFTLELVLGTILALYYAESRPITSGVGIALASIKPNFVIPLVLALAARGNWRALLVGCSIAAIGASVATGWLLQSHSPLELVRDVQSADEAHLTDDYELPVNTWTRVDILAIVAKWMAWNPSAGIALVTMAVLLVIPLLALQKLKRHGDRGGLQSPSGAIAILAGQVCLYHHVYDTIVLIPVACGILYDMRWRRLASSTARWGLALAVLFPAFNYLSSEQVLQRFELNWFSRQVVTSLSGITLAVCLVVMCWQTLKYSPNQQQSSGVST